MKPCQREGSGAFDSNLRIQLQLLSLRPCSGGLTGGAFGLVGNLNGAIRIIAPHKAVLVARFPDLRHINRVIAVPYWVHLSPEIS